MASSISYSADLGDRISQITLSASRSELRTFQVNALDGGSTASPKGVVRGALERVNQFAKWFDDIDEELPEELLEDVFVYDAAKAFSVSVMRDRYGEIKELYDGAMRAAISALDTTPAGATGSGIEVRAVIREVAAGLAKRGLFPSVNEMLRTLDWVIRMLWFERDWSWTRRKATMTIGTDSTVTITAPSGVTFHALSTRRIYLQEGSHYIQWASEDELAPLIASNQNETGSPRYFRFDRDGEGTVSWTFYPAPSKEFVGRAWIKIAPPAKVAINTFTTALPEAATQSVLADLLLARLLTRYAPQEGREAWRRALEDSILVLMGADNPGTPDTDISQVRDYYNDFRSMGMADEFGGYGL